MTGQPSRNYLCASVIFCFFWGAALNAQADDAPYQDVIAKLERLAQKNAFQAQGVLPLIELAELRTKAPPQQVIAALERISKKKQSRQVQDYARWLLASAYVDQGDYEAARKLVEDLGYQARWRVAGTWNQLKSLPRIEELESQGVWRTIAEIRPDGFVPVQTWMSPKTFGCAVATTIFKTETSKVVSLWFGAGGAFELLWDGTTVLADAEYRNPAPDRHAVQVFAAAGEHAIHVRLCTREDQPWGFFLRWQASSKDLRTIQRTGPKTIATLFDQLREQAAAKPLRPQALEDYARFLWLTGAEPRKQGVARSLALAAAEQEPNPSRLALVIELSTERGERLVWAKKLAELAPQSPLTILKQAQLMSSGFQPLEAIPWIEKIPPRTAWALQGARMRAEIYRDLKLPLTGFAHLEKTIATHELGPYWFETLADLADSAALFDRAFELRQKAFQRLPRLGLRQGLINEALKRGQTTDAYKHLQEITTHFAWNSGALRHAAEAYRKLGDRKKSQELLRTILAQNPSDADVWLAMAQLHIEEQQLELAAQALERVRQLKPQDESAQVLLQTLKPKAQTDRQFLVSSEGLLKSAKKVVGNTYPFRLLEDLTVHTVYESGLHSTLHQVAALVHNREGISAWKTYTIQYAPQRQEVDVLLARVLHPDGSFLRAEEPQSYSRSESAYRMYFDVQTLVIQMPDIRPGDVVEVQYRVRDTANHNLFADYFGDLEPIQTYVPIEHKRWVLRAPQSRKFYFNATEFLGARVTHQRTAEEHHYEWSRQQIAPLPLEEMAPGISESSPVLHVSTFASWQDLGVWYWGFIEPQLILNDTLRAQADRIVAKSVSSEEKVKKIYRWVTETVRYVGLELGVHSYLPYRVTDVVRRGFGDCKDKASLLYALLKHVGVDARIALVRTRARGDLATEPASLAAFDHAIAYVPELDLFLDGTAEKSGVYELPAGDQGVLTLVVGPNDAVLRKTPVLPATDARAEVHRVVNLQGTGAANVLEEQSVQGHEAPAIRIRYQAPGTRLHRLQQEIASRFSGAVVRSMDILSMEDPDAPVRFRYEVDVPHFATLRDRGLYVRTTKLYLSLQEVVRQSRRRLPLELGPPRVYVEHTELQVPAGTQMQLPVSYAIQKPFGSYKLELKKQGDRVFIDTELQLNQAQIGVQEYAAFRTWLLDVIAHQKQEIVIVPRAK